MKGKIQYKGPLYDLEFHPYPTLRKHVPNKTMFVLHQLPLPKAVQPLKKH
jgi:hypothetical protein